MALAEYFSKNLLAISQVLKKGTSEQFQSVLNNEVVGIAFDEEVEKKEGKAALDLTIRLLSRLYPKIKFIDLLQKKSDLIEELVNLSKAINYKIELSDKDPTLVIAITAKQVSKTITKGPVFYIGSDGWTARFSSNVPVGSGDTSIPFAAGVSACLGASNTFRHVFRDYLTDVEYDNDLSFSLINLQIDKSDTASNTKIIEVGRFILVGFGAIGNGAVWALARAPFLKGEIVIVEPEAIEITNLQRYVLAEERHDGRPKIEITQEFLKNPQLKLEPALKNWAGYLNDKKDWMNEFVLIAIDNAKDRIGIQSSLPKEIINSYTENNLVGISRHTHFCDDPCLVCTYMPTEQKQGYAFEVSQNLGIPQFEREIGGYLYANSPADEKLLNWVAQANNIHVSNLEKFKGLPVREFYAKVVCGGTLLELKRDGVDVSTVEAPLAFQSAFAGILLISEFVIQKAGLRKMKLPTKTHFHPLYQIKIESNPYNHSFPKDSTGRCICSDIDFLTAYKNKWSQ